MQAGAAAGLARGEALVKNPGWIFFCDAGPVIAHFSPYTVRAGAGSYNADLPPVATRIVAGFPGVADEVDEDSQQLVFLDEDGHGFVELANHFHMGIDDGLFILAQGFFDEVGELDGFGIERVVPKFLEDGF